jgi:thymidine phosphorylase
MAFAQRYPITDICILCADVERSIAFYAGLLGFRLRRRAEGFADFSGAGLTLACWEIDHIGQHTGLSTARLPGMHQACIAVELPSPAAVDEACRQLAARGVAFRGPPADYPWNARCSYFTGPDGEVWELYAWREGGPVGDLEPAAAGGAAALPPQEVIRRKRDGAELGSAEIAALVRGITAGSVAPAQIGAFTMATYLRGMTPAETTSLALAMRDSGRVLDWSASGLERRRIIDKHSSGGVGDEKITLIVVPLAAACGLHVPNLSGWGLDYCGGEIDVLDAIEGYDSAPEPERFMAVVRTVGGAISGPTRDLAPADRIIFKVRDVTATVESIALITGSIMSKKLAVAPSGLVVTVGSGSGAYMANLDQARALAESMANVGAGAGVPSTMLLTDLDAVLGTAVGAAVEVVETVDFLTGRHRDPRVLELVLAVTAEMIVMAGLAPDLAAGEALARARLEDGSAAARFGAMVAALGGPAGFVADPMAHMPAAPVVRPATPARSGIVTGMDAKAVGLALVALGGGRRRPEEPIDLAVGFTAFAQPGDAVGPDRPLCLVHARDAASAEAAADRIRAAVRIGDTAPPRRPIVLERLTRRP